MKSQGNRNGKSIVQILWSSILQDSKQLEFVLAYLYFSSSPVIAGEQIAEADDRSARVMRGFILGL